MAAVGAGALCLVGCAVISGRQDPTRTISIPPAPLSALVVIVDPDSAGALHGIGALLTGTGRAYEHVFVIDASSGAVLASGTAPRAPRMLMPDPPVLPHDPTSFERASYRRATESYQVALRHEMADLRLRQRRDLAAWTASAVA